MYFQRPGMNLNNQLISTVHENTLPQQIKSLNDTKMANSFSQHNSYQSQLNSALKQVRQLTIERDQLKVRLEKERARSDEYSVLLTQQRSNRDQQRIQYQAQLNQERKKKDELISQLILHRKERDQQKKLIRELEKKFALRNQNTTNGFTSLHMNERQQQSNPHTSLNYFSSNSQKLYSRLNPTIHGSRPVFHYFSPKISQRTTQHNTGYISSTQMNRQIRPNNFVEMSERQPTQSQSSFRQIQRFS